jgi:nitrate reductase delta subunit
VEVLAVWTGDQTALAARYVETFDLRRRASLHLTYYAHGDTRERGMALLRLKKLYRAAGLPMASPELPDHLTVMLAFSALAPDGHGAALLGEHRAAIELLRLSLHDLDSPYAHVLDAIGALLGDLSVRERHEVARLAREGPPDEAVGLEPYGPPEAMPTGAPGGSAPNYAGGMVG